MAEATVHSKIHEELREDLHEDLATLWSKVVTEVGGDGPNRAVLQLAKPLGLLKGTGTPNLLIAAPNAFVKDIIRSEEHTSELQSH